MSDQLIIQSEEVYYKFFPLLS